MSAVDRKLVLTLYSSDGIQKAWRDSENLVREVKPCLMLHTTPGPHSQDVAEEAYELGLSFWYGVGIDGWARDLRSGARSYRQIQDRAVQLATVAKGHGAECIMWNGEAAWKLAPGSDDTDYKIEGQLTKILAEVDKNLPGFPQAFTSFDHPRYHRMPWRDFLGAGSPLVIHSPQFYGALLPGQGMASIRDMQSRLERMTAQWRSLERSGECYPKYSPGGSGYRPYMQLHGVSCAATVKCALQNSGVCLWASASRMDKDGERALKVLKHLEDANLWQVDGVQKLQESLGLVADGIVGGKTLSALQIA